MSNIENDENIRVNIRTGTSTRVPRPRNSEISRRRSYQDYQNDQLPFEGEITIEIGRNGIPVNSYQDLMSLMHLANMTNRGNVHNDDVANSVLARSMYDSELHRNPTIRLDIRPHHCKTTEVDGDCSVCQSKFNLGDKLSTLQDCRHTFHHHCLQEWGKYKQECPLCRAVIPILER